MTINNYQRAGMRGVLTNANRHFCVDYWLLCRDLPHPANARRASHVSPSWRKLGSAGLYHTRISAVDIELECRRNLFHGLLFVYKRAEQFLQVWTSCLTITHINHTQSTTTRNNHRLSIFHLLTTLQWIPGMSFEGLATNTCPGPPSSLPSAPKLGASILSTSSENRRILCFGHIANITFSSTAAALPASALPATATSASARPADPSTA